MMTDGNWLLTGGNWLLDTDGCGNRLMTTDGMRSSSIQYGKDLVPCYLQKLNMPAVLLPEGKTVFHQ